MFKLAERFKELKSNNDNHITPQCGISNPGQKASSFSKLMTNIMNDVIEELIGSHKLCNIDTTDTGGDDGEKLESNSGDGSSQHDFYLI